jgi:hypothetical protein
MTKAGRWKDMGTLIDDEVLNTFAVVTEPDQVPAELLRRYGDIFTRLHLHLKGEIDPDLLSSMREQMQAHAR